MEVGEREKKTKERGTRGTLTSSGKDWVEFYGCIK